MRTVLTLLALAGALVLATASCGGGEAVVKAVKKDPKKKEAKQLVTDARERAAAGKNDDADRLYGEAYATASDAPKLAWEILVDWVDFLEHANRPGRARDVAKQYFDANPADPKGYDLYAETLIAAGKGQEALEVANQLLQLVTDGASGHDKRGRALIVLEQVPEGVEELRKAVQIEPGNAKYHMALGAALHKMGDVNKAALEFRAALKAAPDDPEAHILLGMALRDQGEKSEAKTYLDKAIALDPRNGRAYFELGLYYSIEKMIPETEAALTKAVTYAPNESRFWYAYGEIYRVQDRTAEAISAYRKALELEPPYPKALGKLGAVLADKKQYDEAETLLTQAIHKDEKTAINYWHLGRVYAGQHKNRQAIDALEAYLKHAGKNDDNVGKARAMISDLKRK
jgi:Flp pilus assembly protein TadD